VAALGGPADILENPDGCLAAAPVVRDVMPAKPGYIAGVDVFGIGMGIVELGGGRAKPSDAIDHAVGIDMIAPPGAEVGEGAAPLCRLHARDEDGWQRMAARLQSAVTVTDAPLPPDAHSPLILKRITA
jgi:thymidine phosphorylase